MDQHIVLIYARIKSTQRALWALRTINITLVTWALLALGLLYTAWCVVGGWRGSVPLLLLDYGSQLVLWTPILVGIGVAYRVRNRRDVARHMERCDERINDALLTILSAEKRKNFAAPEVLTALGEGVVNLLHSTPLRRWAPWNILRRGGQAALFASVVWSLALATQGAALSEVYHLLTETPERISQRLAYAPLIGDLKLTITPPSYTGSAPRFIEGGSGDFEALEGSIVKVEATLSRRGINAQLWKRHGEEELTSTAFTVEGRTVKGELTVDGPFKWSISLVDLEGVEWREAAERQVIARPDSPPRVQIISPESGDRVDPARELTVALKAKDDFGFSAGKLLIALDSDIENPEELPLVIETGKVWSGKDQIDLSVIEAQGGDRIALWAQVSDNRQNGEGEHAEGPQTTVSEVIYLEIDSPEWAHRKLLDELREHLEQQLEALGARLELDFASPGETLSLSAVIDRWGKVRERSLKVATEFDQLVQRLGEDQLTPREIFLAFTGKLISLQDLLEAEVDRLNDVDRIALKGDQKAIKLIHRESGLVEVAHEEIIILIEAMVARMALEEMAQLADELKASRAQLKELIEQYRRQPSEALKSRIRRELQRFKQKMQAMREMMEKLQKKVPKEFLNLDGMKSDEVADRLKESESQVSSIEKLLEEGKIDEALNELDELSKALEEMSQQLQDDMDELHRQSNPELEEALSELMDSTRDLMRAQEELKQDTQAQQDAIDQAVKEEIEQAKEVLDELKRKVARIDEIEKQLKLTSRGRYTDRIRQDTRKSIDDLERAIENQLLNEGIEAAQRNVSDLSSLRQLERRQSRRLSRRNPQQRRPDPTEASRKDIQEALGLSGEVLDTLLEIEEKLRDRAEKARQSEAQKQRKEREAKRAQEQDGQQAQSQQGQSQQNGQQRSGQPSPQGQPQSGRGQGSQGRPGQPQSGGQYRDSLAGRQSKISRGLERLQSRLEARKEKIPALNQVPTEPFERAGEASRQASQELQAKQPGRGMDGQQQVGEALKEVMKSLQDSKKPQRGQRPGQKPSGSQSGGRRDPSTERVELPERGERGPDELRKELLDAMKSKPTRGYDDQVKAYYESLVR